MAQDVDLAAALSALLAALGVASSDEAILEYATGVLSTMVEDEGDDDLQGRRRDLCCCKRATHASPRV